jgi:hypothetical protein
VRTASGLTREIAPSDVAKPRYEFANSITSKSLFAPSGRSFKLVRSLGRFRSCRTVPPPSTFSHPLRSRTARRAAGARSGQCGRRPGRSAMRQTTLVPRRNRACLKMLASGNLMVGQPALSDYGRQRQRCENEPSRRRPKRRPPATWTTQAPARRDHLSCSSVLATVMIAADAG